MFDASFFNNLLGYTLREQHVVFIRALERLFKELNLPDTPVRGKFKLDSYDGKTRFVYSFKHPQIHVLSKESAIFEHWSGGADQMGGSVEWASPGVALTPKTLPLAQWEQQKMADIVEVLNGAQTPRQWWESLLQHADVWAQLLHQWEHPNAMQMEHMRRCQDNALRALDHFVGRTIASVQVDTPALVLRSNLTDKNNRFDEHTLEWSLGCPFLDIDHVSMGFVQIKSVDAQNTATLKARRDVYTQVYHTLYDRNPPIFEVHKYWERSVVCAPIDFITVPIDLN